MGCHQDRPLGSGTTRGNQKEPSRKAKAKTAHWMVPRTTTTARRHQDQALAQQEGIAILSVIRRISATLIGKPKAGGPQPTTRLLSRNRKREAFLAQPSTERLRQESHGHQERTPSVWKTPRKCSPPPLGSGKDMTNGRVMITKWVLKEASGTPAEGGSRHGNGNPGTMSPHKRRRQIRVDRRRRDLNQSRRRRRILKR